jgi:tetratricopeptide (TPR) repeat protein
MDIQNIELECPGCGRPISIGQKVCSCGRPIVISTFSSVSGMSLPELNKYAKTYQKALATNPDNTLLNNSVAMCYLKLKMYDKAYDAFEKAIEDNFDNPETYFYAAISLLSGHKAFLTPRPKIDKIEELLTAAISIEPRGIFYLFWSYIKYDYFKRKFLRTSPDYIELLSKAKESGYSDIDRENLFSIIGIECPSVLMV